MGKVGQTLAFQLLHEDFFEELSLVDAQNGSIRASKVVIDLAHAAATLNIDAKIHSVNSAEEITTADLIVVTAGRPAVANQGRRDLVSSNSIIIRDLARKLGKSNPRAKYIIVTNPVDAMSTLFQRESGVDHVVSSGCHIDSLRLRSELSNLFGINLGDVNAFVGGEHGSASVFLWSTVRLNGNSLTEYIHDVRKEHDVREQLVEAVREKPEEIIRTLGGVAYGPACAVADVVRAISRKQNFILSVGLPFRIQKSEEYVHVSKPISFDGGTIVPKKLTEEEDASIENAALTVFQTYKTAQSFAQISTN